MATLIESEYFIANIDRSRIESIYENDAFPTMSLWEKIKDFFAYDRQKKALECLYKLCHPSKNFTSDDIEEIFFKLQELASPGCKARFYYDNVGGPYNGKLYIKDDRGNDILYIEKNGKLCNYSIVGKTFIFEDYSPPDYSQILKLDEKSLSISFFKEKPNLRGDFIWMRSGVLCLSFKERTVSLDFDEFYNNIFDTIKYFNTDKDFNKWMLQEKITFWSALVNKRIDEKLAEMKMNLSGKEKEEIFNAVQNNLDIVGVKLDSKCAQSSIKHTALTVLNKREEVRDFINEISTDKEQRSMITSKIINELSHHIYERLFKEDGDLYLLKERINNIHATIDNYLDRKKETTKVLML